MVKEPRVPDEAAREILRRAAEIDRVNSESMSLETLRAAAREAGIAESSIDAALTEHAEKQQQAVEVRPTPTVPRRRVILGVIAFVALLVGGFMFMRVVSVETRAPAPTTQPGTPAPTPPTPAPTNPR